MTESQKAWKDYRDYRQKLFGGPGNGCDDYRYMTNEEEKKLMELYQKARKLEKEGG